MANPSSDSKMAVQKYMSSYITSAVDNKVIEQMKNDLIKSITNTNLMHAVTHANNVMRILDFHYNYWSGKKVTKTLKSIRNAKLLVNQLTSLCANTMLESRVQMFNILLVKFDFSTVPKCIHTPKKSNPKIKENMVSDRNKLREEMIQFIQFIKMDIMTNELVDEILSTKVEELDKLMDATVAKLDGMKYEDEVEESDMEDEEFQLPDMYI